MDVARSATYMFRQPGGIGKLIIGGLLLLIPIIGWLIVAGYVVRTVREVALGADALPDWADWGEMIIKGLVLWLASLLYSVPGFVLDQIGLDFISWLWSLAVYVFLPAAVIRYAVSDNVGAFLEIGEIWQFIRTNANNYITALIVVFVAGFVAAFGVILLIIGVIFTMFWAMLVAAHAYGSVYAASRSPERPVT